MSKTLKSLCESSGIKAPVTFCFKLQWYMSLFIFVFTTQVRSNSPSYRNHLIDLQSRSIDWFLYDEKFGLESTFLYSVLLLKHNYQINYPILEYFMGCITCLLPNHFTIVIISVFSPTILHTLWFKSITWKLMFEESFWTIRVQRFINFLFLNLF